MTDIDAIRLNFSPESLMLLNGILAIVMFSIALDLKPSDFRALVRMPKALLTGMVSQFLVLPALTFAIRPRPHWTQIQTVGPLTWNAVSKDLAGSPMKCYRA